MWRSCDDHLNPLYDYRSVDPHICDDWLATFEHEALLTLDEPGEATLIIRGRGDGGAVRDYLRTVWVRE